MFRRKKYLSAKNIKRANQTMILWVVLYAVSVFGVSSAYADKVVFSDDFQGIERYMPDGTKKLYPDHTKWAFTFWPGTVWPDSYGDGTNYLAANNECQVYVTPWTKKVKGKTIPPELRYDPFSIHKDGLHITADILSPQAMAAYDVKGAQQFGSGIIISRFFFKYGKVKMVAKLPSARGSWPAFWLLAQSRKWPPEIDIFEAMAWGPHKNEVRPALGASENGVNYSGWFDVGVDVSQDFHEYALDWNEKFMSISFDGKELIRRQTPEIMKQDMYILINLAVGGHWAYNELGIKPIDGKDQERLLRGTNAIKADYPATMVVKSVEITQ